MNRKKYETIMHIQYTSDCQAKYTSCLFLFTKIRFADGWKIWNWMNSLFGCPCFWRFIATTIYILFDTLRLLNENREQAGDGKKYAQTRAESNT